MSEKKEQYGPIWQLEQQVKHYEALAGTNRADANRLMRAAEDNEAMATLYRNAVCVLKLTTPPKSEG